MHPSACCMAVPPRIDRGLWQRRIVVPSTPSTHYWVPPSACSSAELLRKRSTRTANQTFPQSVRQDGRVSPKLLPIWTSRIQEFPMGVTKTITPCFCGGRDTCPRHTIASVSEL